MPASPSVRHILRERTRSKSRRGKRTDEYHVALVIECGGMRGVAAGGAAIVLADAQYLDAFDTLHGSSSGACVAAYLLAGQAQEGQKIYLEDICNRRVVSPYRFWTRPSMVDTDYIADEIIGKRRALRSNRIIDEPGVLNVVLSAVQGGSPVVRDKFKSKGDILLALKASLRVPGPLEPGVLISNELYLDGGITAPVPFFSAAKKGATHILVIGTQRKCDYSPRNILFGLERIFLRLRYSRNLSDAYWTAHKKSVIEVPEAISSQIKCDIISRQDSGTYCAWYTIDKKLLLSIQTEAKLETKKYLSL